MVNDRVMIVVQGPLLCVNNVYRGIVKHVHDVLDHPDLAPRDEVEKKSGHTRNSKAELDNRRHQQVPEYHGLTYERSGAQELAKLPHTAGKLHLTVAA